MKNTAKKILSLLLAAVMIFGAVAAGISGLGEMLGGVITEATTEYTNGYYYYVIDDEVIISSADSSISGDITIPQTLDGYPVASIQEYAFAYCTGITSVTICGNGIMSVGEAAFDGCANLTSVTMNNGVTSIGNYAFQECTSLTSVTIPYSVTSIGDAFTNCENLTDVYYGGSEDEWSEIDGSSTAFEWTGETIHYDYTEDLKWKFDKSNGILTISDTGNMKDYDSGDAPWYSIREYILSVDISGITSIGSYAFFECINLTSINIPNRITSIGYCAFQKCKSLTSVTIPSRVTSIGDGAFNYCTSLASVIIPQSITNIGDGVFSWCTSLTSVTIPNSVTSIANNAFIGCASLTSVDIPDSVTSIGEYAFAANTSLANITIPDSVISIGDFAVAQCSNLMHITVDENNEYYSSDERGALFNKNKTEFIQYPNGNTNTSYTIPSSVTAIDDYAFYWCTNLTNIIIPDSVMNMGEGVFGKCTSLADITIPDSVTSIGDYAFRECTSLSSVTLGNGVTNIGEYVFYDCTSLSDVTLGNSVSNIGKYAFYNCTSLTDIYYIGSAVEFNNITIEDYNDPLLDAAVQYISPTQYYTLTYNANGGSGAPSSQTGNATYTISSTIPTRSGYTFLGWSKSGSATSASYTAGDGITLTADTTLYAVWETTTNIYNLGEETYSFDNFGDSDSPYGHCFGMSMTSSAYYTGELDISTVGGSAGKELYTLTLNSQVKKPICKYQDIQGNYSLNATVAGGSYYKNRTYNIDSDWTEVINYVKNHEYDNKGTLQIGFRKNGEGGHAINFLRYEEVNGQQRIYAYDNNFPDAETYFYKDANGKIQQAPYSTFSGSIDCIALRSVSKYFDVVDNFDSTRYIYADRDTISVNGVNVYPIDGEVEMGERVMFEIPANVEQVTITPLVDNAEFEYLDEEYSFGSVNDDTVGVFTLATTDDNSGSTDTDFTILNGGTATASVDIRTPSTTTISYGDAIILHADVQNLPAGVTIKWTASNGNFDFDVSSDGKTCEIAPSSSGDTEFTAEIVDSNGNSIGRDTQKMTSKAGFFQKIIAFFKRIFGLTKTIPEMFR